MKKIVHVCEEFEKMWLGKDNSLIPLYMKDVFNYKSEIWTYNKKKDLPLEYRGMKFIKIKEFIPFISNFAPYIKFLKRLPLYLKIIKEAKNINVLMLFHISKSSYWNAYIYKKMNPKGKVYIKADFNLDIYKKEIKIIESKPKSLKLIFRKKRYVSEYKKRRKLVKFCNLISYESLEAYNSMKEKYAGVNTSGRTIYIPNTIDEKLHEEILKKKYKEKENIFLTVGRLGTEEKNTEFLLEALSRIDLKKWKFYFVGPLEDTFKRKIELFFLENKEKKNNIIFTGAITNKNELLEIYNKSKVFILPSKWESFGIVMVEAMSMGNYILTSNTCAAKDLINNGEIGEIFSLEDTKELRDKIENIIIGKTNLELSYEKSLDYVKKFYSEKIVKELEKRL